MKQILRAFLLVLLPMLFGRCEDNTEFTATPAPRTTDPHYTIRTLSTKHLPDLTAFLQAEAKISLYQKDTIAGAVFDTDYVVEVTDTLNVSNYSFRFTYPGSPEHIFYNLVVSVSPEGIPGRPHVLKYTSDPAHYEAFKASGYDFAFFTGNVALHRFTDYFPEGMFSGKSAEGCTELGPDGAPLPCEQTPVDSGNAGGGSNGEYSGGNDPAPGSGQSGAGGTKAENCSIVSYWSDCGGTNGDMAHAPGLCGAPGSPGAGWVVVIDCGELSDTQNMYKAAGADCEPCGASPGGMGVNPPYAVSNLNLAFDDSLTPVQLQWLTDHDAVTEELNSFMIAYGFSEEAKTATLLTLTSLMNATLSVPYDAAHYTAINSFTQPDLTDPYTAAVWAAHFSMQCAVLKLQHPEWSDLRVFWEASKEMVHLALDIGGLVPVVGEVCDLVNGVLYTLEGDGVNASLSFAATIPIAGWFATGAKLAYKGSWKFVVKANGLIDFGVRNSKKFREALGLIPGDGKHAHHIIPWDFKTSDIVQKASKSKDAFHINEALNGIPLPSSNHLTGHHLYNTKIESIFTYLGETYPNMDSSAAYNHINALADQIKDLIIANPNMNLGQISDLINYP